MIFFIQAENISFNVNKVGINLEDLTKFVENNAGNAVHWVRN